MTDAPQEDLSGTQISGYEILNVIGQGGMATVYRARQVSMQRIVALKVLPRQLMQDDTYMQRFHREVEIVSRLEHRNIVPVHDYGEFEGQPYIVMRYMPAGSVDDLLNRGALEFELALKIIEQIAPALDYAHVKGVLHRDLKPSNILMDDNGDAYLTDFGIARVLGENRGGISITTTHVVGTPSYMSPEQ
ncbi:MAG: serine/threonine protein kinase, partial [Anaerolineae bacterium]|nr:serine/threonine protein kinase [Anaerolineae bacterium]